MQAIPYIYPPRATSAVVPADFNFMSKLGWRGQWKYNDTHIIIRTLNARVEVWNRHAKLIEIGPTLKEEINQIIEILKLDTNKSNILDGGWLENKHRGIKGHIVLWDILAKNGNYLLGTTYGERYNQLISCIPATSKPIFIGDKNPVKVGQSLTDHIFVTDDFPASDGAKIWDQINEVNKQYSQPILEGIMYKDYNGVLTRGTKPENNSEWMTRSRVTTKRHRF